MSNAQHSYNRSFPLPRFSNGSISEAVRVIEEIKLTNPIFAARTAHIDRTLAGVVRFQRSGGL
jgi:hypothetical protein